MSEAEFVEPFDVAGEGQNAEQGLISRQSVAAGMAWATHYAPAVVQARKDLQNCWLAKHDKMYSACNDLEAHYHEVFHNSLQSISKGAQDDPQCMKSLRPVILCVMADRIDCATYIQPFLDCATKRTA